MASLKKRNGQYYAQFYVGGRQKRVSLNTDSLQVAKEKLRQIESAQTRGEENFLPTRTPIAQVVSAYVEHIRTIKTPKSAQTDVYYLRQVFGAICPALECNSRKQSIRAMKRPPRPGQDRRFKMQVIEKDHFEQITTADVAGFTAAQVRCRGLAPKTANRYREILHRLFAWAMEQGGIKMPQDKNPVAKMERYKEKAPEIRFLTLQQIQEQLNALADRPQLQVMVALYIYAGLRREEALWLTTEDVDLDAGTNGMIRVRAKTIAEEAWQPKTKSNRAVPISQALRGYLEKYTPGKSEGNWFFPSPNGRHYDPDNFSQDLAAANKTAGLQWTCLHYRHTFGSQLAMKGESLFKISTLMGNSPEICRRHYAALIPEALADTVEFPEPPQKERCQEAPTLKIQKREPTFPRSASA